MKATGHRELPIIFTAESVRAILAGRKSQTRRLINPQPNPFVQQTPDHHPPKRPEPYLDAYCGEPKTSKNPRGMGHVWCWWTRDNRLGDEVAKSRFIPGDRLWVKEAWGLRRHFDVTDWHHGSLSGATRDDVCTSWSPAYRADWGPNLEYSHWRSPLYMPRWASRIALEVTEVRAQRVQAISEEDARAEGVHEMIRALDGVAFDHALDRWCKHTRKTDPSSSHGTARGLFASIWDRINGRRSPWSRNDFVFAYTFRRVEK